MTTERVAGEPLDDIIRFIDAQIKNLSDSLKEPWQKTLLQAATELIEKNGPAGLTLLSGIVTDIFNNKPPKLDGLSLRTASDILATMERASADRQKEINDFLNGTLKTLGDIVINILVSLIGLAMKQAVTA